MLYVAIFIVGCDGPSPGYPSVESNSLGYQHSFACRAIVSFLLYSIRILRLFCPPLLTSAMPCVTLACVPASVCLCTVSVILVAMSGGCPCAVTCSQPLLPLVPPPTVSACVRVICGSGHPVVVGPQLRAPCRRPCPCSCHRSIRGGLGGGRLLRGLGAGSLGSRGECLGGGVWRHLRSFLHCALAALQRSGDQCSWL